MRIVIQLLMMWLPWKIRRWALTKMFGYTIHPTAWIGKSIIVSNDLEMAAQARINNLVFCRKIDRLSLDEGSSIANLTFITGFETNECKHFNRS